MPQAAACRPRAECCAANSTAQLKPLVWQFPAGRIPRSASPDLRWAAAMGWLMGVHGATCDNLLSADVVMADSRTVTANCNENADLFWALRGGGGNFGIVTSFRYRLHPVGPTVMGGAVMYAYKDALKVLSHFRDFASSTPDTLTVYACLICDGDRPVVAIAACYVGSADGAEATVAPLRKWGTIVADQ